MLSVDIIPWYTDGPKLAAESFYYKGCVVCIKGRWTSENQRSISTGWPFLRVDERPLFGASPEVAKDDHAGDRRIRAPKRSERVPLERHYDQQYREVRRAEDYHHPDLREKQRATSCNHIEHGNGRIVGRLIDVHDTVSPNVQLQRERRQRPQNIERGCSAEYEERYHAPAVRRVRLEQQHAERQQKRQEPLRIEHERRPHVVRHRRGESSIQSQPDESLDELMNGEERWQRREKQFAPVLHLRQCDDADGPQNSAAHKVRCC